MKSLRPAPCTTELCIGPMSVNVTRTAIDLAYVHNTPITLIASRRQIECAALGRGYVNNWTTEEFADFVRLSDPRGLVRLARDHGGPWQGQDEETLDEAAAMARAMESYRADILSGFTLLHIDPNKNPAGETGADIITFTRRTQELLTACHGIAVAAGKKVGFEIGTDEGLIGALSPEQTEKFIIEITEFCRNAEIPLPEYAVVQTGTKVMERRNTGPMDSWIARDGHLPSDHALPRLVALCQRNGIKLKQHNTDYLSNEALALHPHWGIDAANVAPEFGVIETLALADTLERHGGGALVSEILDLALASHKWYKWMIPGSPADDREKAIIAGHYIFAHPEFINMKSAAARHVLERGTDLDESLCAAIRRSMERYLRAFNLIGQSADLGNVRENKWMAYAS
jgi:hypothetical protein